MKFTKEIKTEVEFDVELPYYSKEPGRYYCVISEDEMIIVSHDFRLCVEVTPHCIYHAFEGTEETTKQEFMDALDKTVFNLKERMPQ